MDYLTDKERKAPLTHVVNGDWMFKSCMDLSDPVEVIPLDPRIIDDYNSRYTAKIQFTAWWCTTIHRQLNGFPGFSTVQWNDLDYNPEWLPCGKDCLSYRSIDKSVLVGRCMLDGSNKLVDSCYCHRPEDRKLNGFPGFDTVKRTDLNQNPNPPECRSGCIHKKIIHYGGPSGDYLAKCLYDGTHKKSLE